jgi:peptidoglycan/LPS O-acetylase OafA/YrhL
MKESGSSPIGHLPYLDGLRGVAIVSVFLFHALGAAFTFDKLPWNGNIRDFDNEYSFIALYPFTLGHLGVSIFFVISGYCIHLSHSKSNNNDWLQFFNRRFFRIYPTYLFAILIFVLLSYQESFMRPMKLMEQVLANVLAIQNFWEHLKFGINPSFWSIAVEIQLYLLYPLVLFIVKRFGWNHALLIIGSIEILLRTLPFLLSKLDAAPIPFFIRSSPFSYWGSWALGAYLAENHLHGMTSRFKSLRFDLFLFLTVISHQFKPTSSLTFPLCAITTVIVMERFHAGKWRIGKAGAWPVLWTHLSKVGVVSYSFYLFHQPILLWTGRQLHYHQPALVIMMILLMLYPLILVVSHWGYRYLEQPSIAAGRSVQNALSNRVPTN